MTNIAKKIALPLAALWALLLPQLYAVVAHANSSETFVSIAGDDTNTSLNCVLAAPCQHIDVAMTVTNAGGVVACLDTGLFSTAPVNITQAITIDCHDRLVGPMPPGAACNFDGIHINAPGGVVTLRNIHITGVPTETSPPFCGQNGIGVAAAAVVNIEDCVIENYTQSDISVTTSANTILNVRNTVIKNAANGISFAPTAGVVNGSIEHTTIARMSDNGITTNGGSVFFTVTGSVIANAAGVGVNSGGAGTVLGIDSSSVSNNHTGFATTGGMIRISRNVIYDNTINYSIAGGVIATAGNNSVAVNGSTVPNGTITQQ